MPDAYSIANVVVSASIEPEAFGRVSVEAQSMKRPIIASDIGGSKETDVNEFAVKPTYFPSPLTAVTTVTPVINLPNASLSKMGSISSIKHYPL